MQRISAEGARQCCKRLTKADIEPLPEHAVAPEPSETLADEYELAIAHTPSAIRDVLATLFALDERLARIVSQTTEPMLGQMRLAWWREMLGKPIADRPTGDAVLDAAGEHWQGREAGLVALVDGWEHLLADPPLTQKQAMQFSSGREQAMITVFAEVDAVLLGQAAKRWSLADVAAKVSLEEERNMLVALGLGSEDSKRSLPRQARGLAVLAALGTRALKRGGRPLMEGRGAGWTAFRAALLGR